MSISFARRANASHIEGFAVRVAVPRYSVNGTTVQGNPARILIWLKPVPAVNALFGVGATTLFVAVFATAFTVLAILGKKSSERAFLQRLTGTVNDLILELTSDRTSQLSPEALRSLLVEGGSHPLMVNGVSGLHLKAVPQPAPKPQQNATPKAGEVTTTRIVIAATPPNNGITSFDRLLETATTDPGFNSAAS